MRMGLTPASVTSRASRSKRSSWAFFLNSARRASMAASSSCLSLFTLAPSWARSSLLSLPMVRRMAVSSPALPKSCCCNATRSHSSCMAASRFWASSRIRCRSFSISYLLLVLSNINRAPPKGTKRVVVPPQVHCHSGSLEKLYRAFPSRTTISCCPKGCHLISPAPLPGEPHPFLGAPLSPDRSSLWPPLGTFSRSSRHIAPILPPALPFRPE